MIPPANQPDRRQYKRISKHFIVRYYDLTYPDLKYEATQLKNVSIGGVCLITAKMFTPSTRLAVDLKTPFQAEMTHLEGVVLESHERIRGVIYETRMKFNDVKPEAEFVLNKLVEHFEKEEGLKNE